MKLPPEAIREYKEICLAEFGEKLSDDEAEKQAQNLLTFLYYIFNKKT
jgi:hypothetical protein